MAGRAGSAWVAEEVATARDHRSSSPTATAQAVCSRRWPRLVGGAGHLDLGGALGEATWTGSAGSSPGTSRKMPWRRRLPRS
jgi:hypothetical protein